MDDPRADVEQVAAERNAQSREGSLNDSVIRYEQPFDPTVPSEAWGSNRVVENGFLDAVQDAVHSSAAVAAVGGATKTALSREYRSARILEMAEMNGILEYDPFEYTFTALAGTPVKDVQDVLEQHGQYLPFDPVLVDAGATLGGTVASGLSGPGRVRYGGVRDFILGVRFVDGRGNVIRGGGKVVKNAAGFDYPKLMVGSLGRLGVMLELSFKVFPKPKAFQTARFDFVTFSAALEATVKLSRSTFDLEGLELIPWSASLVTVLVRLGGVPETLRSRVNTLESFVGQDAVRIEGDAECAVWDGFREFKEDRLARFLVKVPVTPGRIPALEERISSRATRRYGSAGNIAWIGWNDDLDKLETVLNDLSLSGLVILGETHQPLLGRGPDRVFLSRVKQALDPDGKFPGFQPTANGQ